MKSRAELIITKNIATPKIDWMLELDSLHNRTVNIFQQPAALLLI